MHVLIKGLNFVPTPSPRINSQLDLYWPHLLRQCRKSYHNILQGNISTYTLRNQGNILSRKQASIQDVPTCPLPVEQILIRSKYLVSSLQPARYPDNMSDREREALKDLVHDGDIVIKEADKGMCITIVDKSQYIQEGYEHLDDTTTYERIDTDYTKLLTGKINSFLKDLLTAKDITEDLYLALRKNPDEVRSQMIYFLRKIHKSPHQVRPIVSGVNGPTELVSALVDSVLKPYVQLCPHVVQNTTQVINTLENLIVSKSCLLATSDVKSLYLRIPQEEATQLVLDRVYGHPYPPHFSRQSMTTLLRFILRDNIFTFNGRVYRQTCGVAMGTRCAPSLANLFMACVEEDFLRRRMDQELTVPTAWLRYLDDLLIIWEGSLSDLRSFAHQLDSFHPNIRFTTHIRQSSVEFLDIMIFKGARFAQTQVLDVAPYAKPCNTFQYLHFTSSHPRRTFRAIVRGEAIRCLRNSSSPEIYGQELQQTFSRFSRRGYPYRLLRKWTEDIIFAKRNSHLTARHRRPYAMSTYDVRFKLPFHPGLSKRQVISSLSSENLPFHFSTVEIPRRSVKKQVVRARLTDD